MPTKNVTIKFIDQPLHNDNISVTAYGNNTGIYNYCNGENKIDFTFKSQSLYATSSESFYICNDDLTKFNYTGSGFSYGPSFTNQSPQVVDADSNGEAIACVGDFGYYNGSENQFFTITNPHSGIIYFNSSGSIGASSPNCVRWAHDNGLYIGGGHSMTWLSTQRGPIFKLQPTTLAIDTTFSSNIVATGLFNSTTSLTSLEICPTTNKLYVGYTNSSGGGRVVRLNTNGTLDAAFTAVVLSNSTVGGLVYVTAIAIDPSNNFVLIGGNFELANSTSHVTVVKVDTTGTIQPFVILQNGKRCKTIKIYDNNIYIATNAVSIMSESSGAISYDVTYRGLVKMTVAQSSTMFDNDFNLRLGRGISSDDYRFGINDIQFIKKPECAHKDWIVLGGNFKTFGGFKANSVISFPLDVDFRNAFDGNNFAEFNTVGFGDGQILPTEVNRIITNNINEDLTVNAYTTNTTLFGRIGKTKSVITPKKFNEFTSTFTNIKQVGLGYTDYYEQKTELKFQQLDTTDKTIYITINNFLASVSNNFNSDTYAFDFTNTPTPGKVTYGASVSSTIDNFITEFNSRFASDISTVRNVVNPEGISDSERIFEMTAVKVGSDICRITIKNSIWSMNTTANNVGGGNLLLTSTPFVVDVSLSTPSLSQTYINTYKKLLEGYDNDNVSFTQIYSYGNTSSQPGFDNSKINVNIDTKPTDTTISFYNILQSIGKVELYSESQLLDESRRILSRSPAVVGNEDFITHTKFDIYTYNGLLTEAGDLKYSITKNKLIPSQYNIWCDISKLISEGLESAPNDYINQYATFNTLSNNESRWVKVISTGYNVDTIVNSRTQIYHVMDGYYSAIEDFNNLNNVIPRILTPKQNTILRGSVNRITFDTRDLTSIRYKLGGVWYDQSIDDVYRIEADLNNSSLYSSWLINDVLEDYDYMEVEIKYGDDIYENIYYTVEDECMFDTYDIIFKNKWGVLQTISVGKKSSKTLNTTSSDYTRNIRDINGDYDISRHTTKQINTNGTMEWVLNTNYVPEYMNESFEQLWLSNEVYIKPNTLRNNLGGGYIETIYPVIKVDQNLSYKTLINDKLIQYTIKVKLSHNVINNIR